MRMNARRDVGPVIAAKAIGISLPVMAQVSQETRMSTGTSVCDGVATRTTKVVGVKKVKTHRPKRILGVKVGHKTHVTKIVHEKSVSSNGDVTTSVKTSH